MGENPKIYRVRGTFLMGGRVQPFTREIVSMKPDDARERVYSELGSKHRVKRKRVVIKSIEEIAPAGAMDPAVRQVAGEQIGR